MYYFIISKARGPGGKLLVIGPGAQTTFNRTAKLHELDLTNEGQMWAKHLRGPDRPGGFGIQNKAFGTWLQPLEELDPNRRGAYMWLQMSRNDPWGSAGDFVTWYNDNYPGPYNALAWQRNWERKINIKGDGPYSANSSLIMWGWCGGAINELWRFWEATGVPRAGSRVLLTNFEHIVQLGATPDRKVYMHPNRDSWETWTIEDAGNGQVYLRSAHGTYLGSRENGEVYVTPNRDAWERWLLTTDDGVRLQSAQWRLNLGSRPDGSIYTHVNRQSWERWWATHV